MVSTREEQHHRPEAERADVMERHRPGKQKRHFEIEDDEQQRHQIEAHVELHPRVVERVEAAFVSRQLFRVGVLVGDDERRDQQGAGDQRGERDEDDERQVVGDQTRHAASAGLFRSAAIRGSPIAAPRSAQGETRLGRSILAQKMSAAAMNRSPRREGGEKMAIRRKMARETGLEPATSGVTGRRSNQLSYSP